MIVQRIDYVGNTQKAANGPLGTNPIDIPNIKPDVTPVLVR